MRCRGATEHADHELDTNTVLLGQRPRVQWSGCAAPLDRGNDPAVESIRGARPREKLVRLGRLRGNQGHASARHLQSQPGQPGQSSESYYGDRAERTDIHDYAKY